MSMDNNELFEDCVEFQSDETDLLLDELKKWIVEHKKFPQNIPDVLLQRFLKVCDYDLGQTQDLLLLNFKLRTSAPNLFANRDITTEEMQTAINVLQFCPMPKLTKDKLQITIGGFNETDPNKFCYNDCIKMALMMFDTRFYSYDNSSTNEISNGEIVIMDMQGMSFRHFFKVVRSFQTAKFYMHYLQEAAPIKIVQVNIVNPSPVIDKIFSLFRPFMKKELLDVIAFHSRDYESLHERVGIENLPSKYGGTSDVDLSEAIKSYTKKIENFRLYLMNDDNWRFSE